MYIPRLSAGELLRESRAVACIFDMDGVLADTETFHLDAWEHLMSRHHGGPAPRDVVRDTFGQTNDVIIPILWNLAGKNPGAELPALSREKEELYRTSARGRVRPLAGLERFLGWLRREGVPLAIGTSGPTENVRFLLEEFGWDGYFDVIVHRGLFASGKPAPDCFLKAAELLRAPARRTIVFEDSVHGLRSARQGGFQPCAIGTTCPESVLRQHALWVLRDFRDVAC